MKFLEVLRYAYILIFGIVALVSSFFIYSYFDNIYAYAFPLVSVLVIIFGIKRLIEIIKK